ncbi:MAG: enoyl-CoA hydratase/isomerase family protein [Deltaproteobacteria bacterium]|nr:enoyl-CoA hydratase/isomerase family protein [Deltaproteobacteria bacterium]
MNYETILVEIKDRIATVTLNRPDKFNTFSSQLAKDLNDSLRELDRSDDVAVIVVKGAGKAFSTGIDIAEYPGKSLEEYRKWIALMDEMHLTIAAMAKPVIAMVHGFAVANGAGLLAAADFAVVAEGTKIGTTAINVGLLCTGPIIPISQGIGKKKALEMLLSGDMIDTATAEKLGLVNRVVPLEKLEEETLAFAQKLLSKSPLAIKIGKQFYYKMLDLPFREKFEHSSDVFAEMCVSEDAREGVDAFLSKRPPNWKGK